MECPGGDGQGGKGASENPKDAWGCQETALFLGPYRGEELRSGSCSAGSYPAGGWSARNVKIAAHRSQPADAVKMMHRRPKI
jgi:hypothetical protein